MTGSGTNAPVRSRDIALDPALCIHNLFERRVRLDPQAVAVSDMRASCSYQELDRASTDLARRLRQCGVGPDTLVGLSVPRGIGLLVGALGILKAGGAYVALDPAYPPQRLSGMVEDAQLRIVVCTDATRWVAGAAHAVLLDSDDAAISAQDPADGARGPEARNLAYAVYTSGSTGRPKASLLEHRGLVNLAHEQGALFKASSASRVLLFASFSFDAATFEWVMALTSGAQLCVPDEQTVKSPAALSRFVATHQITHATLPPAMLAMLEPGAWRSVTTLIVAGEACSLELAERWCAGRRFFNAYGPSEMTVWSTTGEFISGQQSIHIGRAIGNTQCLILDESRAPVAPGEAGELYIAGVGISRGYLGRPDLTAERFVLNPFSQALSPLMFRSGDRVRELPDGNLEFLGRFDRQVKVRGFRVEPEEIERSLTQHPAVGAAAVEPQPWQGTTRLVAYVAVDANSIADDLATTSMPQWEAAFDRTYRGPSQAFADFTGWNSSYTRAPIPQATMFDWRDATVARIRALRPRRLLEVGCGAGLLLAPLVRDCEHYTATDISTEIIARLERDLHLLGDDARKVVCRVGAAHQLRELDEQRFDTIVVNSVIHYFPDDRFLVATLARLIGLLDDGGRLFVGDVRNLNWLEKFHASVLRFQGVTESFERQLKDRVRNDRELVVAPEFFLTAVRALPGVDFVEVLPKLGHESCEMNVYRYDAVIHRAGRTDQPASTPSVSPQSASRTPATTPVQLEWDKLPQHWRSQLHREIAQRPQLIRDIPNARICSDPVASDPVEWLDFARKHGCEVQFALGTGPRHDRFHVLLRHGNPDPALTKAMYVDHIDIARGCNEPQRNRVERAIEPMLREHLRERLPAYMEPAAFVILPCLPMTANGKIDRRALPVPTFEPPIEDDVPLTDTQRKLRAIWQRVLGTQRVGIEDNFLRLGGDSLTVVTMGSEVHKTFGTELDWTELQAFTLARLAERIDLHVAQRDLLAASQANGPAPQHSREVMRL